MKNRVATSGFFVKSHNEHTGENEVVFVFADDGIIDGWKVNCYAHAGQHSEASVAWVKDQPLATESEYEELLRELTEFVGYDVLTIGRPAAMAA